MLIGNIRKGTAVQRLPARRGVGGNEPVVENSEVVNNFVEDPSSAADQSATQDTSTDANADTDPATDPSSDDSFAADDGGDFLGGGDSYV